MNPPRNMLSRDFGQQPMQDAPPMNMLARGEAGGMGQMPPMMQPGPAPQQPGMPSQQDIDEAWARNPNDMTGEAIEQMVRRSGGALVAPWDREQAPPDPRMLPPRR